MTCCNIGYDMPLVISILWIITSLTYSSIFDNGPSYLSDLLNLYVPTRQLRSSSDDRRLTVPRFKSSQGEKSFKFQAPLVWNALPHDLRHSVSYASFKSNLKTHLFSCDS